MMAGAAAVLRQDPGVPFFRRKRPALPELLRATPGALPPDGALSLAGVGLEGSGVGVGGGPPVAWRSIRAISADDWERLAAAFPQTGLWPVLLEPLGSDKTRDALTDAKAPPTPPALDAVTPDAVLAAWWEAEVAGDEDGPRLEGLEPFGETFPGLAPASSAPLGRLDVVGIQAARVALVPVARPADVVAAIAWSGPASHEGDAWKLTVVLRSWEDRFGVVPVVLGADTLELAVRRPVTALDAVAVAAEFFAFCPDAVWQGAGSLQALAAGLVNARRWPFWWG